MKYDRIDKEEAGGNITTFWTVTPETIDEARYLHNYASNTEFAGIRMAPYLTETLAVLRSIGESTAAEIGRAMGLESPTAINNRMAELYRLGFVTRRPGIVETGGRHYLYTALPDGPVP